MWTPIRWWLKVSETMNYFPNIKKITISCHIYHVYHFIVCCYFLRDKNSTRAKNFFGNHQQPQHQFFGSWLNLPLHNFPMSLSMFCFCSTTCSHVNKSIIILHWTCVKFVFYKIQYVDFDVEVQFRHLNVVRLS